MHRAKRAIALVTTGAASDLRHFRKGQPTLALAVKLAQRRKGDMSDVHVEPHANGIGGNEIIDLAGLVHGHLRVAGAWAQRAHHHRSATLLPAQHFGNGIDFGGGERDDGGTARQAGQLLRPGIGQRGKARPGDDLGLRDQLADERPQRFRSQDHGFGITTRPEQPIGEHMAAFGIGTHLAFVDRHEGDFPIQRHRFDRAQEPTRAWRHDLFLAGDQRD